MDLASMKPMMSHHSPAVHQQPLQSFIIEHIGPDPHFIYKDHEEKGTKLIKYIQPYFFPSSSIFKVKQRSQIRKIIAKSLRLLYRFPLSECFCSQSTAVNLTTASIFAYTLGFKFQPWVRKGNPGLFPAVLNCLPRSMQISYLPRIISWSRHLPKTFIQRKVMTNRVLMRE